MSKFGGQVCFPHFFQIFKICPTARKNNPAQQSRNKKENQRIGAFNFRLQFFRKKRSQPRQWHRPAGKKHGGQFFIQTQIFMEKKHRRGSP